MADGGIRLPVGLDLSYFKKQVKEFAKDLKAIQKETGKTEKAVSAPKPPENKLLDRYKQVVEESGGDLEPLSKKEQEEQSKEINDYLNALKEEEERKKKEEEARKKKEEAERVKQEKQFAYEKAYEAHVAHEKEKIKESLIYPLEEDFQNMGYPELGKALKSLDKVLAKKLSDVEKEARELEDELSTKTAEYQKRIDNGGEDGDLAKKEYAAFKKKIKKAFNAASAQSDALEQIIGEVATSRAGYEGVVNASANVDKATANDKLFNNIKSKGQYDSLIAEIEREIESIKKYAAEMAKAEGAETENVLDANPTYQKLTEQLADLKGRKIEDSEGFKFASASEKLDKTLLAEEYAENTTLEERKALLAEIKKEMKHIEKLSGKISKKTGADKDDVLKSNTEYQRLSEQLEVLTNKKLKWGKQAKKSNKEAQEGLKNTKKESEKTSSSFGKGIKKLAQMGLAIFGIRGAYEGVRSVINEYLATNQQLQGTMDTLKAGFASILGPAIEYVINLFVKAISAVNSFVYALTGINFVAKANTAALKKQNAAAGGGSGRQSAGFDEQTKLSESGGGGSSNPYVGTLPDGTSFDLSFLDPLMEAIRKFKEDISPLIETVGNLLKWIWEEVLVPFGEWAVQSFLPAFLDTLGDAATVLNDALLVLEPLALWFWENVLKPVAEWTGEALTNFLTAVGDWIMKHRETLSVVVAIIGVLVGLFVVIPPLITAIGAVLGFLFSPVTLIVAAITGLVVLFVTLYDECEEFRLGMQKLWEGLKGIFSGAIAWIKALFAGDWAGMDAAWQQIKDSAKLLWEGLVQGLKAGWEVCSAKIVEIWNKIVTKFKEIFGIHSPSKLFADFGGFMMEGLVNGLKNALSKVIRACQDIWTAIKNVFSSVGTWFKDTFSQAWQKVKDVFSSGGKIFDGIKDGIASTFKSIVNGLILGINRIIAVPFNAINRTLNTIRSVKVLGIEPFKSLWSYNPLSVPEIPKLALGGIVNRPGRGIPAIIGEAGAEAVLPLENNTEWMDILADKIGGGTITIPITLDGKRIATYMVDIQKKKAFAMNGA